MRNARAAAHPREASGRVAVVEIDAQSLRAVGRFPWPRSVHGALVDKLQAMGASQIGFDVDFSAPSNPAEDAAFAAALKRANGGVILPSFRQPVANGSDRFSENVPIPLLREHSMAAVVNVRPEADGSLVRYGYGAIIDGAPRPSMSAMLAGISGPISERFRIDTAFDPRSIPRFSARDVLDGRIPPDALRGKAVLVGSTAIELGDHYALAGHGLVPGAIAQAMAAETLIAGRGGEGFGTIPALLLAIGLLIWLARGGAGRHAHPVRMALVGLLALLPFAFDRFDLPYIAVVPALIVAGVEWLATSALAFEARLRKDRLTDAATGLPNLRALERTAMTAGGTVIVARMTNYEELDAVLDADGRAALTVRMAERLAGGFPDASFHAIAAGTIAWPCPGLVQPDAADAVEGVAALFRTPLMAGARPILVSPCFGLSGGGSGDIPVLIAQAQLAARQAQDSGQRWQCHSDEAVDATQQAMTLLADLDGALASDDIFVVYQPKWGLAARRVIGAEALVRWRHPTFGFVSPDRFIPLLEESGNIARLTLKVLETALAELMRGDGIGIAVNVSAALLDDSVFVETLRARLKANAGVVPSLTIEVTETAELTAESNATTVLAGLRTLGARVSIDDYGTGRATLTYLHALPADEIKIDKSFVTDMLADENARIMVRSTIAMAHELGIKVVAEGIEDAATLEALTDMRCDIAQGWHIGKPMPATDLRAMLVPASDATRAAA